MDRGIFWCHAAIAKPLQKSMDTLKAWTFKVQNTLWFFWTCRVQMCHLTSPLKKAQRFCTERRTRYKGMMMCEALWTQLVVYQLWKGLFRFWQILQYSQSKIEIFKIKKCKCPQMGKAVKVMLDLKSVWNPIARVQAKSFFFQQLWSSLAWDVYPAERASHWVTEEQEEHP